MSISYAQLNHPLRIPLAAEIHSRPSLRLRAPEAVTHLAVYAKSDSNADTDNVQLQQEILASFCTYFGVACPGGEAKYFFHDFGRTDTRQDVRGLFDDGNGAHATNGTEHATASARSAACGGQTVR